MSNLGRVYHQLAIREQKRNSQSAADKESADKVPDPAEKAEETAGAAVEGGVTAGEVALLPALPLHTRCSTPCTSNTWCSTPGTLCGTLNTPCSTPSALCGTPNTLRGTASAVCGTPNTLRGTPRALCGTPSTLIAPLANPTLP